MFTVSLSTKDILSHKVDCYGYIVEKDFKASRLDDVVKNVCPDLLSIIKKRKFVGKALETLSIPMIVDGKVAYCILVGCGGQDATSDISSIEQYRRALGQLVKEVHACGGESVALEVSSVPVSRVTKEYFAEQTVIALQTAHYHFDEYITEKSRKKNKLDVTIVVDAKSKKEVEAAVSQGMVIGNAVNQARHWVDMPPSSLTPQDLAKKAQVVAKRNKLGIKVFHEADVIKMGMGGLAAVSRGSEVDCALIVLEHKAKKKNAPTLCFVGKGITFDSGGLSLKPADFMETMKEDMSGAAAVISAIDALAQLDCPVNIVAIAPTSENLPSGKATKPGDIVTFYNGKTAEIKNTDAEGRLILADALSYALKHYNPDVIVDLATLTGACSRALGPFYSGLFTQHDDVKKRLYAAADISGDKLWQLPMGDDYKKAIVSTVADICNIGNSKISAGASTAAHFLQHFVGDTPWAHIDIAGTAFDVPNISYYKPGGTGVGVKLLVALAMNWK
jgi:leucyl aminopeptidase